MSLLILSVNETLLAQSIHRYHSNIPGKARKAVVYYSKKYNLPVNLLCAIIQVESAGKKYAVSYAGAKGYMQLMFFTYLNMGYDPKKYSIYNAYYNIGAGAKYLRYLITLFNGNLKMAIACYNCGPWKKYSIVVKKRKIRLARLKTWRDVPAVSKKYYADVWKIYRKTANNRIEDRMLIQGKIVKKKLHEKANLAQNVTLKKIGIKKIIMNDEKKIIQRFNHDEQNNDLWGEHLIIFFKPDNKRP